VWVGTNPEWAGSANPHAFGLVSLTAKNVGVRAWISAVFGVKGVGLVDGYPVVNDISHEFGQSLSAGE